MARATSSGVISFGLVSIPVKMYVACSEEKVSFNMITPTGNRVKQKLVDEVTGEEVSRDTCSKGFEHTKGQYVTFTPAEIKAMEAVKSEQMEIAEFVPLSTVDFLQVEKSYYIGPDKGGAKPYRLLAKVLKDQDRVAVARWSTRGKEQLVLIREYQGGLVLHQMYYHNEQRDFNEVCGDDVVISGDELSMAAKLVKFKASERFAAQNYSDAYVQRVKDAVQAKLEGKEISVEAPVAAAPVSNLMDALKASLEAMETKGSA
jgi:DNA end-binding protein Ku